MKQPRTLTVIIGIVLLVAATSCSTSTVEVDPKNNSDSNSEARTSEPVAAQPTLSPEVELKEEIPTPASEPTLTFSTTDTPIPTTVPVSTTTSTQVQTITPSPNIDIPKHDATVVVSQAEETFTIDVWADNWFALYVNSAKVGEDSVPITTERSFNKERFTFNATRPLSIGLHGKDFKETDSGIEYIGERNT